MSTLTLHVPSTYIPRKHVRSKLWRVRSKQHARHLLGDKNLGLQFQRHNTTDFFLETRMKDSNCNSFSLNGLNHTN